MIFTTRIGNRRWKVSVDETKPGFHFRLIKPNEEPPKPVFAWFLPAKVRARLFEEYRITKLADQAWRDGMSEVSVEPV